MRRGCVMMEAAPASLFEMGEAEFAFEFLVVAFDAPAQFGRVDENVDGRVFGQGRKPVFRRLFFALWPFDEKPFQRMGRRNLPVPGSTGIGGHCFALLSRGGSTDVIAYNGSGRTPATATAEWYERHGIESIERHSPHAVTVPGAVEAWARLVKDHGRRPLATALEPAIELARDGYAVTPRVSHDIGKQRDLLSRDQTASRIFLSDGEAPSVGTLQRQPELAQTLEAIAREGPDAFYRGAIAQDMVTYLRDLGGLHADGDFECAKGEYVTPITTEFRGRTIYECPPNGQGIIALMILKILFALRGSAGSARH